MTRTVENVSSILSNGDFQFTTVFSGKTVRFRFQLIGQGQLGIKCEDLKAGYFNEPNVQSCLATVSLYMNIKCRCCSVAKSCLILCDPMDCSTPGFPVLTISWSLRILMSIESVMPSNHLILCYPLLLPSKCTVGTLLLLLSS